MIDRRQSLVLLLAAGFALAAGGSARADKGSGGGNSGPGGGGDNSGPGGGGGNSGPGGGGSNSGPGGGGKSGPGKGEDDDGGQETARRAARAGKAAPLRELLGIVKRSHPGDVLDVTLLESRGRLIYRVTILERGGRVVRLRIDAGTRRILEVGLR